MSALSATCWSRVSEIDGAALSSSQRTRTTFERFIESEASGGLVLMGSAALGLAMANFPLGFTMSLFIGSLAFEGPDYFTPLRLGVIAGSTLSGVTGYLLLRFASGHSERSSSHGAD